MSTSILHILGAAVRVFYRQECVGGDVPETGPLLLVANHPNGLVDPIIMSSTTPRPLRFLGKAPLLSMPFLGFFVRRAGTVPVYRAQDGADTKDNQKTFEAVFQALGQGHAVCLFPEGISHNEPELQKLKTGTARMALGAEERAQFELGVRIVPVGLVYRAKQRFRSTVATWIGDPIEVKDLREDYAEDPWAAVETLTERIASGLKRVMLELDDWGDLPLVALAERIDSVEPSTPSPESSSHSQPGARLPRLRAYANSLRLLRAQSPERMAEFTQRVSEFEQHLREMHLSVQDLDTNYSGKTVLGFVARNLFWLLIGLPFAVLGYGLFFIPYWLARIVGSRIETSRDIYATVQILSGIVFYCLWSGLLVVFTFFFFDWMWGLALLLLLIPTGMAALVLHDWRRRVLGDIRSFFRLATSSRLKQELMRERAALGRELKDLRAELVTNSDPLLENGVI